jgi:hypothetical protein
MTSPRFSIPGIPLLEVPAFARIFKRILLPRRVRLRGGCDALVALFPTPRNTSLQLATRRRRNLSATRASPKRIANIGVQVSSAALADFAPLGNGRCCFAVRFWPARHRVFPGAAPGRSASKISSAVLFGSLWFSLVPPLWRMDPDTVPAWRENVAPLSSSPAIASDDRSAGRSSAPPATLAPSPGVSGTLPVLAIDTLAAHMISPFGVSIIYVAPTFLSAGSRDFPVPCFSLWIGDWKVAKPAGSKACATSFPGTL